MATPTSSRYPLAGNARRPTRPGATSKRSGSRSELRPAPEPSPPAAAPSGINPVGDATSFWVEVTISPNPPPRLVLVSCPIPRDSHVAAPFSQADFSARGSARRSPFHRASTPGFLELSGTHSSWTHPRISLQTAPQRYGGGKLPEPP